MTLVSYQMTWFLNKLKTFLNGEKTKKINYYFWKFNFTNMY